MAVASSRRQAGMTEIRNKERKIKEELKSREENKVEVQVSEDEHNKRLEMLKSMGILKE